MDDGQDTGRRAQPLWQQLRKEVGGALKRARDSGDSTQVEFCQQLAAFVGKVPDDGQWSLYEQGKVDAPAVLLLAASRASGIPLSRLFDETEPAVREMFLEITRRMDALIPPNARIDRDEDEGTVSVTWKIPR